MGLRLCCVSILTCGHLDREDALKDDFQFEQSYEYDDEDDGWGEEEGNWAAEEEQEEEQSEVRDESTAYLEFLNEEVRTIRETCPAVGRTNTTLTCRPKSSITSKMWSLRRKNSARIASCSSPR